MRRPGPPGGRGGGFSFMFRKTRAIMINIAERSLIYDALNSYERLF